MAVARPLPTSSWQPCRELTKFYEEHAADHDRFEILSICNTEDEKAKTIEAFDDLVVPRVKDVWAGKKLPFPVLVVREKVRTSMVFVDGRPCS